MDIGLSWFSASGFQYNVLFLSTSQGDLYGYFPRFSIGRLGRLAPSFSIATLYISSDVLPLSVLPVRPHDTEDVFLLFFELFLS